MASGLLTAFAHACSRQVLEYVGGVKLLGVGSSMLDSTTDKLNTLACRFSRDAVEKEELA